MLIATPHEIGRLLLPALCLAGVLVCAVGGAGAQDAPTIDNSQLPLAAQGIGVDSKTGQMLPLELTFRDTEQRRVELGTYFDGRRPVMLSFNYSDCPKLCSTQLQNMTQTLREVAKRFRVNDDFQVVSVSIDPNEQTVRSRATRDKFVGMYNQPGTEEGWHFLTGKQPDIEQLADACGFRYKYIPQQKFYSHPPVFILVSPEGKIVRYIHGLSYDPGTMEQALIEAAAGKIGSPINLLSYGLGCFVYDEASGKYTFQAMAIMRIGGLLTVVLLLITLGPYWFYRRGLENPDTAPSSSLVV